MNGTTAKPALSLPVAPDQPSRAIPATQLLGAARVVVIEHKGERYELRLTRNDKLILTK